MKKLISVLAILTLVFALAACGNKNDVPATTASSVADGAGSDAATDAPTEGSTDLIEPKGAIIGSYDPGEIAFYVNVINKAGEDKIFTVYAEQTSLGSALLAKGLIDGDKDANGFVLKTVNGETYNYETDGYAWITYVDGKKTDTSIDSIELKNGATYTFKVETY